MDDDVFRARSAELIAIMLRLFPEEGVAAVIVRDSGQMSTITNLPPDVALDLLRAASEPEGVGEIDVMSRGGLQ